VSEPSKSDILARPILGLAQLAFRRPKLVLFVSVVSALLGGLLASQRLELRMDWTYLFEPTDPLVLRVQEAREIFPLPGDIAVLVDQGSRKEREEFLSRLAAELEREPELFHNIFYRVDLEPIAKKALYFLDVQQLQQVQKALASKPSEGSLPNLEGESLKIAIKLLHNLERSLQTRGRAPYEPLWTSLKDDEQASRYVSNLLSGERWVYTTIGDGKVNALIFHSQGWGAREGAGSGASIKRVREILAQLRPTVKNLRIRLTGLPVMLYDERQTCTDDGIRSGLLSMVAISIIFTLGFGEISRPLQAVSALTCGLGWSLGYTTVAVGHLNFITVSLLTMLMGLGIDFGIHLLFRYDEELNRGLTPEEALQHTVEGTGVDTFVGAAATAVAFLALTLADFRGIAEFGIIASGGVLLCYFSTMTVLCSLLSLFPGKPRPPIRPDGFLAWFEKGLLKRAKTVVMAAVLLLAVGLYFGSRVGFAYNLLEVQAANLDSVKTEKEMVNELRRSVLSGQVLVKGEAEARREAKVLESLPSVSGVGSVVTLVPEVSQEKQEIVEEIVKQIPQLQLPAKIPLQTADDLRALKRALQDVNTEKRSTALAPELRSRIETLKEEASNLGPGAIQDGLSRFQDNLRNDLESSLTLLKLQVAVPPTTADLPSELVIRSLSPDGYYKLSVSAKKNIWEKEHLLTFLQESESVAPDMIGHPVVQAHILEAFDRAFQRTPWFTLAGVLLVMTLYLRQIRAIFLSLIPTATGVVLIFGAMGYVGIDFNVVNFVALPMSIGIGAVYGVHALHRMREIGDEAILSSSTGPAILLSGMTTVAGFSTLMAAHHRGLSSLGFVISVGVAANFIASLVLLPALRRFLRLRSRNGSA
jgi:uncharacterized protein